MYLHRVTMYCKRLRLAILMGLLTSLSAVAEAPATDAEQPIVEASAGAPKANADLPDNRETTDGKSETELKKATARKRTVARNFRPSEEITADNSVAYPVDI